MQAATGQAVEVACVDQGYTGAAAAEAAAAPGIKWEIVKRSGAKRGFVQLPGPWVVERSFAWATRCRRLANDERAPGVVEGRYFLAITTPCSSMWCALQPEVHSSL